MSDLPISTTSLYRFTPLVDLIKKAREDVADAERKSANASSAAKAKPDDATLIDAELEADEALTEANDELEKLEAELAENPDQPVYLLLVPNFDNLAAFEEAVVRMPTYPGDRKMFRAIEATGRIPADDPDYVAVKEALKTSPRGVPEELSGTFQDLYERVDDEEEIGAVRAARSRWQNAIAKLRVLFFLKGFDGVRDLEGNPVPYIDQNDRPTNETLNAIPPDDITAISNKIEELKTLRGRSGNSRGKAKSSALLSPSQPSPSDTETEVRTEIPTEV